MPLSPQQRRPALHAGNLSFANARQNLTELDTRLTKVDKGCQNLTPSTPAPTSNPSKTQQNHNRAHHPDTSASTLAVNPSGVSRTKPEQP